MTLSLEAAYQELRDALTGPEDDVFYDVVAISDHLLRSNHLDADLTAWADAAARGLLARDIPPDKLVCYDILDARLHPLIFSIPDTELGELWPALPLPNLRKIMLGEADIDWTAMPDCDWRQLTRVSVYEGPGLAKGLATWLGRQHLPALHELHMHGARATHPDFVALSRASYWPQLEVVDVSFNRELGGGWPTLPAARSLKLANTTATNDDLRTLLSVPLPHLVHLEISGNEIDNTGFDILVDRPLPALATLAARGCQFTDGHAWRGVPRAHWPSLRHLDLQDSLRDPRLIAAAAPVLQGLTTLELGSCQLDDTGAATLAALEMPVLERIGLPYNRLTSQGAAHLATAKWPRLKRLDIAVNPIGDRGVTALIQAPWWASLEEVQLVRVGLTGAGLAALAGALPRSLRKLSIGPKAGFPADAYEALQRALPEGARL